MIDSDQEAAEREGPTTDPAPAVTAAMAQEELAIAVSANELMSAIRELARQVTAVGERVDYAVGELVYVKAYAREARDNSTKALEEVSSLATVMLEQNSRIDSLEAGASYARNQPRHVNGNGDNGR